MKIYLDRDYKCHAAPAEDLTAAETEFFDGKCKTYIEGYRFVPAGETWTRSDGVVFEGEMAAPWRPYSELMAAQSAYEETLAEMADMREALEIMGVSE